MLTQAPLAVTGRVVEATGLALPGAVIAVKGRAAAAITNDDGSFAVSNVAPDGITRKTTSGCYPWVRSAIFGAVSRGWL